MSAAENQDERVSELTAQVAELTRRLDQQAKFPKELTNAARVLKKTPRSSFENGALETFKDHQIIAMRKYFNNHSDRPLKKAPYMRVTPRVQELLVFLYRFKGANIGCIAQKGIWSSNGVNGGRDSVTTNVRKLATAGLVDINPYTHKIPKPKREKTGRETKPVPNKPRKHITLTTKAINILKADGVIVSGTNSTTLRERLRGEDLSEAIWSHQNNALEAALNVVNLKPYLDSAGNTIAYELGQSDRELHHEQAAFHSIAPAVRQGLSLAEVLELASDKLDFNSYKGRLLAPDATLRKITTRPDGSTHTTLIFLEYDQGNYARAGILERKLELLSGPFGKATEKPAAPDPDLPDDEYHQAYDDSDDGDFDPFGDTGEKGGEDDAPAMRYPETPTEKASQYWAAKVSECDTAKLVFVGWNDNVRNGEERRLGANYVASEEDRTRPGRAGYVERMSARRDYINAHCEFVTLEELEQGTRLL